MDGVRLVERAITTHNASRRDGCAELQTLRQSRGHQKRRRPDAPIEQRLVFATISCAHLTEQGWRISPSFWKLFIAGPSPLKKISWRNTMKTLVMITSLLFLFLFFFGSSLAQENEGEWGLLIQPDPSTDLRKIVYDIMRHDVVNYLS